MKIFTNKGILQKIIISIMICILVIFTVLPHFSYAADDDDGWSVGGALAKELFQLISWLGDVAMSALNNLMLGAPGLSSAMLDNTDQNLKPDSGSWLAVNDDEYSAIKGAINPDTDGAGQTATINGKTVIVKTWPEGTITTSFLNTAGVYKVPNMLYSPENIFANKIAALDINFLQANTFQSIYVTGDSKFENDASNKSQSAATALKDTIASWYRAFRNIAIVGLLSVLIYLGIRIIISSTADDKAKYKESLNNWFVALCLVFVIHFIMSGILMITDKCNQLFAPQTDNIIIAVQDSKNGSSDRGGYVLFKTNLMGSIRFQAQRKSAANVAVYTVLYVALIIYTCIFTFMYFKRFLYMAFFTMIAPLVALTYPIDKAGDGKAQAFNLWFKEYTLNAIIQPVHLILYTVFVGSAANLVDRNPLYALVAMAFLIPAEKFIKKMFGLDRAETVGSFGSFAGGALAMTGMQKLAGLGGKGPKGKAIGSGAGNGKGADSKSNIFLPAKRASFQSFKNADKDKENDKNKDKQQQTEDTNIQTANQPQTLEEQQRRQQLQQFNTNNGREQLAGAQTVQQSNFGDYADNGTDSMYLSGYQPSDQDSTRDISSSSIGAVTPITSTIPSASPFRQRPIITGYSKDVRSNRAVAGRLVGRFFKNTGKAIDRNKGNILRAAGSIAGATAGAAVGLGAGLTTGDLSKAVSMAGLGATAGGTIGNKLGYATDTISTAAYRGIKKEANLAPGSIRNAKNEEKYGLAAAAEMRARAQNQRARKQFLSNKEEQRKWASKVGFNEVTDGNISTLMNAVADYKEAGLDDDLIKNALKAEKKRETQFTGNAHDRFVDVAKFASDNKFGADYIDDDKKRKAFEDVIRTQSGLDPAGQREIAQTFADIQDRSGVYEEKGTLGKPQMQTSGTNSSNKILTGGEAAFNEAKKAATQKNKPRGNVGRPRTKK